MRVHKSELESWKKEAWRGFDESLEGLKRAWVGRKELVGKAMEGYSGAWREEDVRRVREVRFIHTFSSC